MPLAPPRTLRIVAMALTALAGVAFFRAMSQLTHTTFDDAYMFLRYAKHWLAGHGPSWNITDGPAYGCTSFLYLTLVTAIRGSTSMSDNTLLIYTSIAGAWAAAVALAGLFFQATSQTFIRSAWFFLLPPVIVFQSPLFRFHAGTGMETTLALAAMALHAVAVVSWLKVPSTARLLLCLVSALLAFEARPELGLAGAILLPLTALAQSREKFAVAIKYLTLFLLVVAVDAGFKFWFLGSAVPLPFFAKQNGFYEGYLGAWYWNQAEYLFEFGRLCLIPLLAIAFFVSKENALKGAAWLAPVVLTVGYLATVTQIMGTHARFYLPLFPLLVGAAAAVMDKDCLTRLQTASKPLVALKCMALLTLVIVFGSDSVKAKVVTTLASPPPNPDVTDWWQNIVAMDQVLSSQPKELVIVASEYGYIGARHPEMTIVDPLGLHDKRIARGGFSADYILERKPDFIWLPHGDYTAILRALVEHPQFIKDFDFYPTLFHYGVAIRKASPARESLQRAIRQ